MFDYLIDKILTAEFKVEPFEHIYIENFLDDGHLEEITGSHELKIEADSTEKLFEELNDRNFHPIEFPGCTISQKDYVKWERDKDFSYKKSETCESFGMVFRLKKAESLTVKKFVDFVENGGFFEALIKKFEISGSVSRDIGLQKYLNGYEISPHPDTRRKALTFMLNLNQGASMDNEQVHTHYCRLNPEREFISSFWDKNEELDRCWLPWNWVSTESYQKKNNSIVIFAPSSYSLHAVKLKYNHCASQRTQLYGNLWYEDYKSLPVPSYQDFDILNNVASKRGKWVRRLLGDR